MSAERVNVPAAEPSAAPQVPRGAREAWLEDAVGLLRPMFSDHGADLGPVRVSVGFPKGSRGKGHAIGQCWYGVMAADNVPQLFVSPVLDEPLGGQGVLSVLVHELVHVACGPGVGHKGPFKRLAVAVGLEGKMTATSAGEVLLGHLARLLVMLGPYPHAKLIPGSGGGKQTTRLLKAQCPSCEYVIRITQKWADQGLPLCPLHQEPFELQG